MDRSSTNLISISAIFVAGFFTHMLYQRWNPAPWEVLEANPAVQTLPSSATGEPPSHRVNYIPLSMPTAAEEKTPELPEFLARDVEKIRSLTGQQARVRGRVFRVGHSAKSNTYFLNFGPSREALTAVIFSSTVELFDKTKTVPKSFENKEVEITGQIKDHPQYGLEIILENPKQIRILN
jgi:hypothetical protein